MSPATGPWPLVFRTRDDSQAATLAGIREVVRSMDRNLPIYAIKTMEEHAGDSIATRRFSAAVLAAISFFALVIAALGLYGVVAYTVAQRTREIGVRMALGAQRHAIARLMVRSGLLLAGVGVLVGVAAALGLTRVLGSLLYGVGSFDPASYSAVALALLLVAALASWLPARRATLVDPVRALRGE